MERTKETLEARVRETPLVDRLKECQKRIGNMCAELRGPKMSIPVEYYDDDFYICTTLADAQATVEALQAQIKELESNRVPHSMQHVIELQAMNNRLGAQVEALQRERDEANQRVAAMQATVTHTSLALDAEQAAKIYAKLGRGSMPDIRTIGAALKTARQEALREAVNVARDRANRQRNQCELRTVHMLRTDEAEYIANALDRLAGEGG